MTSNLIELRNKRRNWVEANQENGFEDGIKRLLTDLYPDNAHFIYELLQNAEDTEASIVQFTLTNTAVEFEHDGKRLFSLRDVESITSIGTSTKKNDTTSIGKFGVGFKAVFAYTNTPEIHSGDFHFQIHDLVVPETDGVQKTKLGDRETRFLFPFNNPKKPVSLAVKEVERGLSDLGDNTLLFLSHIQKIEYILSDGSLGRLERINKSGGHIEIRAINPGGEEAISHWLRFEKDVEVTDEENNTKICRIAIAYSLAEKKDKKGLATWEIIPLDRGQVSIYFPADKETSNLRFHIHAPFASTVARDSVRECEANNELRDHLADLVVESLATIRDQGLLNVGFLAVLPNTPDNLPVFYEPIRTTIVEAFKSESLTPTKSGSHAPARKLYRGPAQIQGVLEDDDLVLLLGEDFESPIWAPNPPPMSQREDKFLESLEIDSWGWNELTKIVNKPHHLAYLPQHLTANDQRKNLIEYFIAQKEDAWLLRFYALLAEACVQKNECMDVSYIRIVRVVTKIGDRHVKPNEAFFPPEDDELSPPADILLVKPAVYSSGRSEPQKKAAKSFLEQAGVQIYDNGVAIKKILEQYSSGHVINHKTHISHIKQFVSYWQEQKNSSDLFKKTAFLMDEEETEPKRYFKASHLYLDSPYTETGLAALFDDEKLSIKKPKGRLAKVYLKIKNFEKFAIALGVMQQLEICDYKATEMQDADFPKIGKETSTTINKDYFINGLSWYREGSPRYIGTFDLSTCKSMALSRSIWDLMSSVDPEVLIARYVPNEKRKQEGRSKPSFLVEHLAKNPWVPDKDGNFLRPRKVTTETLHPDFKFDDGNGWLTAIKFGEDAKKCSEEYQARNRDAQNFGFDSAEMAESVANILKNGVTLEQIRSLAPQKPEQPKQSVPDPERRRKLVLENTADAPSMESVKRERSIQIGVSEITAQAKAYLRTKYKNDEDQLVCQCCHKEMPFKLRSDDYYFEAVQCIGEKGKETRHHQNRLALCPTCAAMYQHARDTDDSELCRLIVEHSAGDQASSVEIPIRLAGREFTLHFVGTHWFDLKTILGQP